MKWVNTLALFCIVCAVTFFIGGIIFNHIIGGNADSGYHKEEVYMVYNKKTDRHVQVLKTIWYVNYVYTQVEAFFVYLGFVSIGYFWTMYVSVPLVKKIAVLNRNR